MADPTLSKKPRFDRPLPVFVLLSVTLAVMSGFLTLRFLDARDTAPACDTTIGSLRVEMRQSDPPSVFDTAAWESLTDRYNAVFDACDPVVAAQFITDEFDVWAAPALQGVEAPAPTTSQPATSQPAAPAPTSVPATTVAPQSDE